MNFPQPLTAVHSHLLSEARAHMLALWHHIPFMSIRDMVQGDCPAENCNCSTNAGQRQLDKFNEILYFTFRKRLRGIELYGINL